MGLDEQWLAEQFEAARPHLRAAARRLLGSDAEAEDALQDSWLRASRADAAEVENLRGWFTTIVARVCLNVLRSPRSRSELLVAEPGGGSPDAGDPAEEAEQTDELGRALLVVLDRLAPAERLAFVLHDVFAVPFAEVAVVLGRSPVAARQLASRARRRLQGEEDAAPAQPRQRTVVAAFLAASRSGDFGGLLEVLDPEVVLRADDAAVQAAAARREDGAPLLAREVRGAAAVAEVFRGRAGGARPALVDGTVGAVWAPEGQVRAVFDLVFAAEMIIGIEMITDPDVLAGLEITTLTAG